MTTLTAEQKSLVQEKATAIRVSILKAVTAAKSGHPGGSLSIADLMALLYYVEMNVDPKNPKDGNRDRFVLSKGHAAPALYATLAEKGFFDKGELENLRKIDCMLQGHPDMKHTPGVICLPVPWARALVPHVVWHWPDASTKKTIVFCRTR